MRSTNDTLIRVAGLGYTPYLGLEDTAGGSGRDPNDLQVFKPYPDEVNRRIATTAGDNGIPYAEVRLESGYYLSQDGVHPNDEGYEVGTLPPASLVQDSLVQELRPRPRSVHREGSAPSDGLSCRGCRRTSQPGNFSVATGKLLAATLQNLQQAKDFGPKRRL